MDCEVCGAVVAYPYERLSVCKGGCGLDVCPPCWLTHSRDGCPPEAMAQEV